MTLTPNQRIIFYFLLIGIGLVCLSCLKRYSARFMVNGLPDRILRFPSSVTDVKILIKVAESLYVTQHVGYTAILFFMGFLYLQIFSIPGTIYMTLLSSHIFGYRRAVLICCLLQLIGSCAAFYISRYLWKPVIMKLIHWKIQRYRIKIGRAVKNSHWFTVGRYLVAFRIFPFLPNLLLNFLAPMIGVPFWIYCVATFLGALPNISFVVYLGTRVREFNSIHGMVFTDTKVFLLFLLLVLVAVIPLDPFTYIINYRKKKPIVRIKTIWRTRKVHTGMNKW